MARRVTVPGTEYGTGALADGHHRIPRTRRPLCHLGVVVLGVVATVAMLTARTTPRLASVPEMKMEMETKMAVEIKSEVEAAVVPAAIQCWQSSFVDGKTAMMEEIHGLAWKATQAVEAKEEAQHEKKEEKKEAKEEKKERKEAKHKHKHEHEHEHEKNSEEEEEEEKDLDAAVQLSKFELGSAVTVDAAQVYQEILGFGGAFTEASALQFAKLSPPKQQRVLELYFGAENGSNYQLGRVPMGSCDFSTESYNYDDVVNDTEMMHFDEGLARDSQAIIPLIKAAIQKNPKLKLLLAPWSPPAWMKYTPVGKAGPNMTGSAKPVGLNAEFRHSWALYFSKFISAYKKKDIKFWALTPQNEPEFAAPWEGCLYTPEYEADFVGEFLGPVIKRDHPELKLLVFDHNRDHIATWAKAILNHPTAKNFVDGVAFHWYDNLRYMDGVEYHEHLNDTHTVLPASQIMLASEASNCPGVAEGDEAWFRAQRYAHDIITDMNNWVAGWIDWNLILDHKGGPNHLGNICDAPLIMNKAEDDFYIQPMYYFIQHFSKFVDPGSHRIKTDVAVKFSKPGDAQLYPRYPSALYSCDGSSRQSIEVTEDKKLQITGTKYCIDVIHQEHIDPQVELVVCKYTPQTYEFVNGTIRMDDKCLQLKQGSTDNGARVVVGDCVDNATWQKWEFKDGVMHSLASDKCVTAGYAFVQAVSFVTPANKKVTVVLNENTEDAKFDLNFGNQTLKTLVPAGAIRTFAWA